MKLQPKKLSRCLAALSFCGLFAIGIAATSHAALIDLTPTNGVNSSSSVPLSDLVSGSVEGVKVGDKQFTAFNYSFVGDMPQAVDVQVLGFKDQSGNWGVTFHGSFLDLPGGSSSDALIRFQMDIDPAFIQQGYRISDAHLFLNGYGAAPGGYFVVDESFLESSQSMSVYTSKIGSGGLKISDSVDFDPTLTTLHVTKDILADAGNGEGSFLPARATAIDQSFSQTSPLVPEPMTISLLGTAGFLALALNRRHPRK